MATRSSGELSEELRQLLRRIEEIPADDARPDAPHDDGNDSAEPATIAAGGPRPVAVAPGQALAPTARSALHRAILAAPLSIGAVGVAAALATGWSLLPERLNAVRGAALVSQEGLEPLARADHGEIAVDALDGDTHMRSVAEAAKTRPQNETAVARPPAPKPRLSVPAVSATQGERVRFAIRVEPPSFVGRATQVHVQGLPRGVKLSHGRFTAPDNWVIPAADLATLELILDEEAAAGRFDVTAGLHTGDGKRMAEASAVLAVTAPPAARSTDTAAGSNAAAGFNAAALAAPADADNSHEKFLAQGLRLLLTGNVNSARLLFERSAEGGNARAALLLGDSYDDVRLAQLGVEGVLPDRDKASYWYERADELGAPEAKERISEINAR